MKEDTHGFPAVPTVVESEYFILYAVDGQTYPKLYQPQHHDIYYHLHMSGYVDG